MRKHPDLLALREVTRSVSGVESYSKLDNPARTVKPDLLSRDVVLSVVAQHLQSAGLTTATKVLQEEAKFVCKGFI